MLFMCIILYTPGDGLTVVNYSNIIHESEGGDTWNIQDECV